MCGVFGYVGKNKKASGIVLAGLKKLEYRGYDSWGIASVVNNKIVVEKRVGAISQKSKTKDQRSNLRSKIRNFSSFMALGHTRWATHGGVSEVNSHPHLDCTGKIAVVHNGIIENYETLKKELIKKGHRFVSETDSETAAHLIEELIKNNSKLKDQNRPKGTRPKLKNQNFFAIAVLNGFDKLDGLNAVVVMMGDRVIAIKKGSPLVVGLGKNENFVASDATALAEHTKDVVFLEDNVLVEISNNGVKFFGDYKITKIDYKTSDEGKGKYPHFMLKEINEQSRIINNIALTDVKELSEMIKKAYGTYLVGCGTAYHATLFGQYLFSKVARRHVNCVAGSEFGYLEDFLTKKSLVLALSQSGETIDILESVGKAKAKGAKIAAIVNSLGSTLYRMADYKFLLGAGPERAVASTKAFTAKMAVLILTAYGLAEKHDEGKRLLKMAARETLRILNLESGILEIAKKIKKSPDIYVIGRGISHPLALEAALKIKEISYIHAEGFAAGELKHGVIALISKGTPCIVFCPHDETRGAVLSGAMEMRARGGYIIGISHKREEVFDEFIEVKDCGEATAIPNIVTMQLLAYYLSVLRGNNPDMPRNLAKSVTVK